jgi:methionine-rich copper-binding protein CopC
MIYMREVSLHDRSRLGWLGWLAGAVAGLALGATLAAPALAAPQTAAHARYLSSDPAANAVLKAAPALVTIHFAEAVNPAGSAVVIYDAKGQVVSQVAQVDANDLKTMRTPMQGDGSEVYLVYWHTISAVDGDPDVGAFSFFVNQSGASELAPKATPTTPGPTSASGAPIWLAVLLALLGVLVGLAGGVAWSRSRGAGAS